MLTPVYIAPEDVGTHEFGTFVAIDGITAVVGEPEATVGASAKAGAVYVYVRTGALTWTLQQKLTASTPEASAYFGKAVAINGDDILVGAPYEDCAGTDRGRVYVFQRVASEWAETQTLDSSAPADNEWFGISLAMTADAAVIGGPCDSSPGDGGGAVFAATKTGATWAVSQKLQPAGIVDRAQFGMYVGICRSTNDIVGAQKSGQVAHPDSSSVFVESGGTWSEQAALDDGITRNAIAAAISNGVVAVGLGSWEGKVKVWRRTGSAWAVDQTLSGSITTFGNSLSFNDSAESLIIAECDSGSAGHVHVYNGIGGSFSLANTYDAGHWSRSGEYFGCSVAVVADGERFVSGARSAVSAASTTGGAIIFDIGTGVSDALSTPTGRHYNLYLKIDGLEPILWQYSFQGKPSDWSRSFLTCLRAGSEASLDLDLGEMKSGMSAMTFTLDELSDSSGSIFGRLFAPAKYLTSTQRCLVGKASYFNDVLDADDTTIPVEGGANLTTVPGEFHLGQENIYVTAAAASSLTATRGRYPCVGDSFGQVYPKVLDAEDASGYQQQISIYPYSWIGRRVALYATAWDEIAEDWCPESESVLLWVGRISDRIVQRSKTRQWVLSCTSIMDDLENKKIGLEFPTSKLDQINLQGDRGRKFEYGYYNSGEAALYNLEIEIPKGAYTTKTLGEAIAIQFASTAPTSGTIPYQYRPSLELKPDGTYEIRVIKGQGNYAYFNWDWDIDLLANSFNHALNALGLPPNGKDASSVWTSSDNNQNWVISGGEPYKAYHPCSALGNGGYLYVQTPLKFWQTQGDNNTDLATVVIEDATLHDYFGIKGRYFAEYTSRSAANGRLTIYVNAYAGDKPGEDSYVGEKASGSAVEVKQVYVPRYQTSDGVRRGPFEMLLYPLLSTGGQSGYNDSTYDKLPISLSVGIQAGIVDTDSFVNADLDVLQSVLAARKYYVIDDSITWMELVSRECKLFGYAVIWRNGKLTLVNVTTPDYERATQTISESVRAFDEWPDTDSAIDTVVNQYKCQIKYNVTDSKYGDDVIITDVNSVTGLQTVKEVSIEHPGVYYDAAVGMPIKDLLSKFLQSRWLALPSPVVRVSLNHTLINKVFVGDVVKFESTRTSDPRGDGTYNTYCLATVLGISWEYNKHLYTGSATLILHGAMVTAPSSLSGLTWYVNSPIGPWSASASVDISATNGGWDAVTYQLTLEDTEFGYANTDPDDGARFYSGYYVNIIERAPADPENPQEWGPIAVASDYETDGAGILTLADGTTLADWDATKEYVVVFADFADCSAAQKASGTWQADSTTRLLDSSIFADQYA